MEAIIKNGIVTNVIEGSGGGGIDLPENSPVGVGWSYDGATFIAPPLPPAVVMASALSAIAALDLKRIRPLAEGDTVFLAKLNDQIKALRAKLK